MRLILDSEIKFLPVKFYQLFAIMAAGRSEFEGKANSPPCEFNKFRFKEKSPLLTFLIVQ